MTELHPKTLDSWIQGRIEPVRLGVGFSNTWCSSLNGFAMKKRCSMLHNTAVTKQWTTKWP